MIRGATVGRLFWNASFETFKSEEGTREAWEKCTAFAQEGEGGIVLSGPVGTGKTHLLVSLARVFAPSLDEDALESEKVAEYWPMLDLVAALRADMGGAGLRVSDRCMECDLLIVDDFGEERSTDFVLEEVERIIDYRYRDMKPVAISTNLAIPDGLIAKYGNRILSRWVQQCQVVKLSGPDYRKKALKEA